MVVLSLVQEHLCWCGEMIMYWQEFLWLLYTHHVKKALEKIMKSQNSSTRELRVEILSFDVCEYYTHHYHFETPIRVRIWANAEVIKGIFDVKKNKFVIEEPVMFPVYTRIPEKVWEHVGSIHSDGTPKRVEFTDKYEGLVGVDVYDEVGSRTEESWRLKKVCMRNGIQ